MKICEPLLDSQLDHFFNFLPLFYYFNEMALNKRDTWFKTVVFCFSIFYNYRQHGRTETFKNMFIIMSLIKKQLRV